MLVRVIKAEDVPELVNGDAVQIEIGNAAENRVDAAVGVEAIGGVKKDVGLGVLVAVRVDQSDGENAGSELVAVNGVTELHRVDAIAVARGRARDSHGPAELHTGHLLIPEGERVFDRGIPVEAPIGKNDAGRSHLDPHRDDRKEPVGTLENVSRRRPGCREVQTEGGRENKETATEFSRSHRPARERGIG